MNESCPTRMSHVPYESIMSHMNESCAIWISHVAHMNAGSDTPYSMSHMHESCPICMSHVPYESVMSHMNESCIIWISHVAHMKAGSTSPYSVSEAYVLLWQHTATHTMCCNALQHIATPRISLCMTRLGHMWHDLFIWDMTHSWNFNIVQHTATHRMTLCVTPLGHMWHDLLTYGTWLIHIKVINVLLISPALSAMAYTGFSSAWHDLFTCDVTDLCMGHDSFI